MTFGFFNEIKSVTSQFGMRYLILISAIAAFVTVFDKLRAKSHGQRVPEKTLLLISVFGGSVAMYAVMLAIRHKTRHLKFMVGIPVIMAFQAILIVLLYVVQ